MGTKVLPKNVSNGNGAAPVIELTVDVDALTIDDLATLDDFGNLREGQPLPAGQLRRLVDLANRVTNGEAGKLPRKDLPGVVAQIAEAIREEANPRDPLEG